MKNFLIVSSFILISMAFVASVNNEPKKGYDHKNMNTSVHACEDFYQHAIGAWMKNNPIQTPKADGCI
jgi:predicted metalloendopeptidase